MIKTEIHMTREDGVELTRTYSDQHLKIRQDGTGAIYDEAIDPTIMNRTYTETDIPIEEKDAPAAEEILSIILGEENNDNQTESETTP